MLQYMGTRQPPRAYPVPPLASSNTDSASLCDRCRNLLWTVALFDELKACKTTASAFRHTYTASAALLKQASIEGCRWCHGLANGIHGRAYLDAVYDAWAQSDEGGDEDGDAGDSDEVAGRDEMGADDSHGDEDEDDQDTLCNAEYDPAGIWDPGKDHDTLANECNFEITMSFERDIRGAYAFLNIHVESLEQDEDNILCKIHGDRAVDLRYYLHQTISLSSEPHLNSQSAVKERLVSNPRAISLFPLKPKLSLLGSEANFRRVQEWFKTSRSSSYAKTHGIAPTPLPPARLLGVNPNAPLRVVDASEIPYGQHAYACLSYVWGKNQSFVALKDNLNDLKAVIDHEQLPKTIQDAIEVTRRLGLAYLWVDALCIVQDSKIDKRRELPIMRFIYQQSAVTIVAATANAASEGFLHIQETEEYLIKPMGVPMPDSDGNSKLTLSFPSNYKRWKDPINYRAWTFQELLLAQRVVMYTYRGVELIDRINIPAANGLSGGSDSQLPGLPWSGSMFRLRCEPDNVRQIWLVVRGEYTRRKLSHGEDKLEAIGALASEMSLNYGKYLAGLWERDLAIDLQWRRPDLEFESTTAHEFSRDQTRRLPRPPEYRAPSWSWASIDGEVDDAGEGGTDLVRNTLGFRIVNYAVEPVIPRYEFGTIRSASLQVEGRLMSFFWRPSTDKLTDQCDGFLAVKAEDHPHPEYKVGDALLDALEPVLVDGSIVIGLAMNVVERIPGRPAVEGMLLLPAHGITYRRIGFFKTVSAAMYDDIGLDQVTIV